jgi:hypothetical protein
LNNTESPDGSNFMVKTQVVLMKLTAEVPDASTAAALMGSTGPLMEVTAEVLYCAEVLGVDC